MYTTTSRRIEEYAMRLLEAALDKGVPIRSDEFLEVVAVAVAVAKKIVEKSK